MANEGGVYDAVTIASAILHDTVEDTETSLEEILEHFGPEVQLPEEAAPARVKSRQLKGL